MVPACRSASDWVIWELEPTAAAMAPTMLVSRIAIATATSHPKKQDPQLKPPNRSFASAVPEVVATAGSRVSTTSARVSSGGCEPMCRAMTELLFPLASWTLGLPYPEAGQSRHRSSERWSGGGQAVVRRWSAGGATVGAERPYAGAAL